ncbi:MAG: hypothetical protein K2H49_07925, partial [Muribaculaceae bacterium]|nr:hypothetical protein [Muribaculaceae bacterium]
MFCRFLMRLALILPVAFLFTCCADDLQNGNIFESGDQDATISFSVEKVLLTRGDSSFEWESAIESAYLLFYDKNDVSGSGLPIAAVRAEVKEESPERLSFKMPLRLEENKDYRLLAVANADRYVPDGFSGFDAYIDAWCNSDRDSEDDPFYLYHSDILTSKVGALPMVGYPVGGGSFRFTRENGVCRVNTSLSFRRKVARIDVVNVVKEGFVVEGVALCNWRDAVAVEDDNLSSGSIHSSISGFSKFPDADETGIQKLLGELYCFPSSTVASEANDQTSTALILKARYGEDADPSYYRINVGLDGNRAEVKSNTRYSVTVTSVKARGANSPEEAYASEDSNLV